MRRHRPHADPQAGGLGLARILVHDPYLSADRIAAVGGVAADLDTLLRAADCVSLHTPLTAETRHLIGADQLRLMKRTAILINTARGGLIDQDALAAALAEGACAGLDVFEQEPLPTDSPLAGLDNVILSNHVAWSTEESSVELATKAARNVSEVLAGRPPVYPVNRITTVTEYRAALAKLAGAGIRTRTLEGVNGLTVQILEAGATARPTPGAPRRPLLLLLHGFPELCYSWRKVMLPLAEAGYHVVAPDHRGYGATTGSSWTWLLIIGPGIPELPIVTGSPDHVKRGLRPFRPPASVAATGSGDVAATANRPLR